MDEERPRLSTPEGRARDPVADEPPRRFPRLLPPPADGPSAARRLAAQAAGAVLALLLLAWAGTRAVDWLHRQPGYQVAFRDVRLDPPPPDWYRGGRDAFLERVRVGARWPQVISVLDLDPAALRKAFQLNPWVARVDRVQIIRAAAGSGATDGPSNEVVVRLAYRTPVAVALFGDEDGPLVDAEGVLLPREEIRPEAAAPILALYNFSPPADPRFGVRWRVSGPGGEGPVPDTGVEAAARLAGFLHDRIKALPTPFPKVALYCERDHLFVQVGRDIFWWGSVLGGAEPGSLSDEAKWSLLSQRVLTPSPRSGDDYLYFRFTRGGLDQYERRADAARPARGAGR